MPSPNQQTKTARAIALFCLVAAIALVIFAAIVDSIQLSVIGAVLFTGNLVFLLTTK